ncbi:MAG TPA: endonuclease/exonuclease/phosphatase family protein [Polyangiaceae bacterium]|jgi:endonuclease/exonuclease/phosphatase family metal-dependent hydrolase|nr:endonuclease/exonuclease/phosphatase family protein [Polyangiaceae bacterium]
MSSNHLRVATLNIWNRSGPWPERLRLIREQLHVLDPDVLALQEVLRTIKPGEEPNGTWTAPASAAHDLTADQASAIAASSHPHVAYGAAMDYGNGLLFGNAIATKYPILESNTFELPGRETGEARSLLYALVEHPRGKLPVFVTHLNWKLHHGSVRVRQILAICERIKALASTDDTEHMPPVLMGDFNADPDSDEMRFMRGLATIDGQTVYYADAWVYGGDGGPGYTFDRRNRFAALAHEPPRRIDYIYVRGPDSKLRGEPLRTRLAFATRLEGAGGDVWPSDHFGVVSDLSADPKSWE